MPRAKRLNDHQRAYIAAYTNPSSPTYLQSTNSYRQANPQSADRVGCHVRAYEYKHHPLVRSEIERILDEQGATPERGARALADIIEGKAESEVVQYDKAGNIVSRTIAKPRAADRIKAIDLSLKARGHFARMSAQAHAQAEIAKEEYARLLKDSGLPND